MREILFRGFHEDSNGEETIFLDGKEIKGKWVCGYYCPTHFSRFPCSLCIYPVDTIDSHWYGVEVIPETVGQYTGVNDCLGIKVFENDIVRYHNLDPTDSGKNTNQGEVIYTDELAAYTIEGDLLLEEAMFWDISVVGNTFQYSETADNEMSFDI